MTDANHAYVSAEEGFVLPCWCGETEGWMSTSGLESGCAGTGYLHCFCGGDFCVCHNHGGTECDGCDDCEDIRADEFADVNEV